MNQNILEALDAEIARLRQVRAILTGSQSPEETPAKPRRQMSADARRAIGEAQRRRWEKVNSAKKDAAVNESAAD